jgi:hypothetical protein
VKTLYKISGIVAVMAVWVSIIGSIIITRLNIFADTPISYFGVNESTKYLFISGLLIAAAGFIIFAIYARRLLQASFWAPIVLITGQIAQIMVAVTPYNGNSAIKIVHLFSAYFLALSMPFAIGIYAFTAGTSRYRNINRRFFIIEALLFCIGIAWFIFSPIAGAFSEIIVGIAFDIWVLTLSIKFLSHRN